jgi:integrase/recombinase XerD
MGLLTLNNFVVEFSKHLLDKGKSEATVKTYERVLLGFDKWLTANDGTLSNLTRFDVQAYVNHLEQEGKSAPDCENIFF